MTLHTYLPQERLRAFTAEEHRRLPFDKLRTTLNQRSFYHPFDFRLHRSLVGRLLLCG